ncbi:MAG TPA: FecR domain-containing protein, partial [Opitutaceae bacterium]|nr:FecR domain-containing protein [Opitutaceae bacterium]
RAGESTAFSAQLVSLARKRQRAKAITYSVVMLLVCGLGAGVWRYRETLTVNEKPMLLVHVPTRQTLPDGSVVELKADAQIEVAYSDSHRMVHLRRGEAHFDVKKDLSRPFIVSADNVAVRAVGTAFSVQKASANVEVLVTEGVVAVGGGDGDHLATSPLASVEAGRCATVENVAKAPVLEVRAVDQKEMSERLAWRKSRIEFNKAPLHEAVAVMNRYASETGPRLVMGDPEVANVGVIGVFRPDNLEAFADLLEAGFGLRIERRDGQIILRKGD